MESLQTLQIRRGLSGRFLALRRPALRPQIDLNDSGQVALWCRELSMTWLELFNAVDRVGTDVGAVRCAVRTR